jgi:hypothetical protein
MSPAGLPNCRRNRPFRNSKNNARTGFSVDAFGCRVRRRRSGGNDPAKPAFRTDGPAETGRFIEWKLHAHWLDRTGRAGFSVGLSRNHRARTRAGFDRPFSAAERHHAEAVHAKRDGAKGCRDQRCRVEKSACVTERRAGSRRNHSRHGCIAATGEHAGGAHRSFSGQTVDQSPVRRPQSGAQPGPASSCAGNKPPVTLSHSPAQLGAFSSESLPAVG